MGIVKENLYKLSNKRFLRFFKNQTIFPYYHLVKDTKAAHIENLYEYKNVAQFNSDLEFLLQHYNPISPKDLLEGKINCKSFLLSFDDGLSEIYYEIYPILKAKNISAVFFINPEFVDNEKILYKHSISVIINQIKNGIYSHEILNDVAEKLTTHTISNEDLIVKLKSTKFSERHVITEVLSILKIDINKYLETEKPYVTKKQIQEMIDRGFYFGGHTMSHPQLNQLSFDEQKSQIIDSIEWLKVNFDIDYSLFAFPFTDKNISKKLLDALFDYDQKVLVFGNSGIKRDYDRRIIQRFSLENPKNQIAKVIVTENLYKLFNKFTGNYNIKRK